MSAVDCPFPAHEGLLATHSRLMTQDWIAGRAHESARTTFCRPQMRQAIWPPTGIWTTTQPLRYSYFCRATRCRMRDADVPPNALDRSCMIASGPPPNQLLRMLDAVNFDLLRPHLITIELVRETVLGEAGVALQHVHFPNNGGEGGVIATICQLHAGVHTSRHQAMGAAAVTNEPIAKISRGEHDGTYPCRE